MVCVDEQQQIHENKQTNNKAKLVNIDKSTQLNDYFISTTVMSLVYSFRLFLAFHQNI